MKKILGVYSSSRQHRIGEGLLARTLFSQRMLGRHVSPFLLLDHVVAVPASMPAAMPSLVQDQEHRHRHYQRLTIVEQGQVEFVDALGNLRLLTAGDVQCCILPASDDMAVAGGGFRAVPARSHEALALMQLWVELPPQSRLAAAAPQLATIDSKLALPDGAGSLRVIAGECQRRRGLMPLASACDIWELQLKARCAHQLRVAQGRTLLLVVLSGALVINGDQAARSGEVVMLDQAGQNLFLESQTNTHVLLLSGEPVNAAGVAAAIQ